ncbi:hypothetical protein LUZ62_071419 [Rhynchospora pubera]|uniref:DUF7870 domain-containing protein n=1 Tax=Rhynchospora pubera TaxID=906938 RepID=A0AAV8CZE4_9POAL|nr:hypothetical protein LUZ62_071419 [Rhynchospora pubera]
MKGSGSATRHTNGHTVVIHLPDPRLLLLVARLAIVAAIVFSIPWLRRIPPRVVMVRSHRWSDDPFFLPMLIKDLKREGLFSSGGQRAIFLGNAKSRLPLLKRNGIDPVSSDEESMVGDQSVDFALASEGFEDASVRFVDRVLKIGGVVVTRLNTEGSNLFQVPGNYKLVYVRRFGSTMVALRKVAVAKSQNGKNGNEIGTGIASMKRLLAMPLEKKDVLHLVEDVLLEPPREIGETRKIKFLPDLTGDVLTHYPRRVFIDAGLRLQANGEKWFEENYPKKGSKFEMVKLNAAGNRKSGEKAYRVSGWLERNVEEEEFVVMKAEAKIVEEMVNGKENAIQLIDELFLGCDATKAYWECLELYGKVKDEGVVVHQWWG